MIPNRRGRHISTLRRLPHTSLECSPAASRFVVLQPFSSVGRRTPFLRVVPLACSGAVALVVQGGIQPKPGHHANRILQRCIVGQQFEHRKTAVGHHDQRRPGNQRRTCKSSCVPNRSASCVAPAVFVVALRRCHRRQKRQRPHPLGPGIGTNSIRLNHREPAGFDKMTLAGAHRVTVDTFRRDLARHDVARWCAQAQTMGPSRRTPSIGRSTTAR